MPTSALVRPRWGPCRLGQCETLITTLGSTGGRLCGGSSAVRELDTKNSYSLDLHLYSAAMNVYWENRKKVLGVYVAMNYKLGKDEFGCHTCYTEVQSAIASAPLWNLFCVLCQKSR